MEENRFRGLLRSGKFSAGMFGFIPAEAIVDLAGYAGFDFMIFDTEHASYDVLWIERLVRASEAAGIASVVRIAQPPDPGLIARVLNTGVHGLMFARVAGAAQAAEIVQMVALPPVGTRGACPGSRSGEYFLMDQSIYTRGSNDVAISLMIESKQALAEIEDIVRVPGIDAVAVGPVDLSYSIGVKRDDPIILEAERRVTRAAREAGISLMASAKTMVELEKWLRQPDGPRVFWYTTDAFQIGSCFQGLIGRSRELVGELDAGALGP